MRRTVRQQLGMTTGKSQATGGEDDPELNLYPTIQTGLQETVLVEERVSQSSHPCCRKCSQPRAP
jgi:hypothetical protein